MKIKEKIRAEKEKMAKMDSRQRKLYFRDYYLLKILLILVAIFFLAWFIRDAVISSRTVYNGATIGFETSEEGEAFLTKGFIKSLGKKYKRKKAALAQNVLATPYDEAKYNKQSMEAAFISQVSVGMYQYILMPEAYIEALDGYDFYTDLSEFSICSNPDLEFYVDESGHKYAVKVSSHTKEELGVEDDIYLVIIYSEKPNKLHESMIEYLCLD